MTRLKFFGSADFPVRDWFYPEEGIMHARDVRTRTLLPFEYLYMTRDAQVTDVFFYAKAKMTRIVQEREREVEFHVQIDR